jgi:hypothetical protein
VVGGHSPQLLEPLLVRANLVEDVCPRLGGEAVVGAPFADSIHRKGDQHACRHDDQFGQRASGYSQSFQARLAYTTALDGATWHRDAARVATRTEFFERQAATVRLHPTLRQSRVPSRCRRLLGQPPWGFVPREYIQPASRANGPNQRGCVLGFNGGR